MTLVLSEDDVASLVEMKGAVAAVEEAFRQEAIGDAVNSPRTRSKVSGAQINAMHAASPYLGRGGAKVYMSTPSGTRFVFLLFDTKVADLLAVMGADVLGRYRTGAASGVATKHLYGKSSAEVGVCGSGKQALTQVLAVSAVTSVRQVKVWSPRAPHREAFAKKLVELGFDAHAVATPREAAQGSDVVSTITSSKEPFLQADMLMAVSHLNVCGGNDPDRAEVSPDVVSSCRTVVVDDLAQGKVEYGDLIQAATMGLFSWESAVELKDIVGGKVKAEGRTLFKSGGAALEDVALGSLLYDKAKESGRFPELKLA